MTDETDDIVLPSQNGDDALTSLTTNEIEIIDFINNSLLDSEVEAKEILKKYVAEEYGEEGSKVWNMIMEDDDDSFNADDDCPSCGEISEEWIEKTKQKMQQFDVFIDDTYDDLVNDIVSEFDGVSIPNEAVIQNAKDVVGDDPEKIEELVKILKKKILFHGIAEGWLMDEYFV